MAHSRNLAHASLETAVHVEYLMHMVHTIVMPWLAKTGLQLQAGALPQELTQHFSNTLQRALPRFCGGCVGCGHETAERRRGKGGRERAAELMENEGEGER